MNSPDLLRRFTPTPLTAHLRMMRRRIRLETNSDALLQQTVCALDGFADSQSVGSEFLWRLVTENDAGSGGEWPELNAFTDGNLSVINVEHAGFIAVDREQREAVGFIPEALARDSGGFEQRFLPTLLTLTGPALGLRPVVAACLARSEDGVLVFGKPDRIKMAFDRWALELEPCAEGVIFLEATDRGLQAWSRSWPLSSHSHAEQPSGNPSTEVAPSAAGIRGRVDDQRLVRFASWLRPAFAISCVFIDEQAGDIPPAHLQPDEVAAKLEAAKILPGGKSSTPGEALICEALVHLPNYRLSSGTNAGDAAAFFRTLLGEQDFVEVSP